MKFDKVSWSSKKGNNRLKLTKNEKEEISLNANDSINIQSVHKYSEFTRLIRYFTGITKPLCLIEYLDSTNIISFLEPNCLSSIVQDMKNDQLKNLAEA